MMMFLVFVIDFAAVRNDLLIISGFTGSFLVFVVVEVVVVVVVVVLVVVNDDIECLGMGCCDDDDMIRIGYDRIRYDMIG